MTPADEHTWADVTERLVRGLAGGMLFGIPLLYTMEVWWIGSTTVPLAMAAVLALTFVPVILLIRTAGFRQSRDLRWSDDLMDAVEAVALGVVSVTLVLVLLSELSPDTPFAEGLGKVVYEATPFALGVAVARHILSRGRDEGDEGSGGEADEQHGIRGTLADIGATIVGAVFIGFNISPTDEIPMLAAAVSPLLLLLIVVATLIISYGIVFVAGFGDQDKRRAQQGILQHPITETFACYIVALAVSFGMLTFFRNVQVGDPWPLLLEHTVLLGLPAAIGGAAGRLAI